MRIIIWYIDVNGLARLQMLDKPWYIPMIDFLQNFQNKPAVNTVLEAYSVSAVHEVFGSGKTITEVRTT